MKNIKNFSNVDDYLSIFNGSLLSELIILSILYYTPYFNSKYLKRWYETYRLSAVIADVFILIIGIIISRYIFTKFNLKWNFLKFLFVTLLVQVFHDYLFYKFFSAVPRNKNKMLDLFKDYAKEVSFKAILGDSFMIFLALFFSSFFAYYSKNINIVIFVLLMYLLPYILYTV